MTQTSFYLYEMFFKALSNKTRFEIIRCLKDGPRSVNDLCKELKFEQSRVSHNLKKLEHCGFVQSYVKGKMRIYSIDAQYIIPIMESIDKYIKKYDKRLKVCSIKLK
jgi:DNA-binding transcriptional ArsR family regulator